MASGITSMDPAFARIQSNIWVVNQIFEGLVSIDDSLRIIPAIAKRWVISKDGLTYTFILRNDVYFHEDKCFKSKTERKVKASDFVFSFYRLIDPTTASPGAWIFNDKVAKNRDVKDNAFQALNDSTFQIKLSKPFRPFLQLLTLKYASVVPEEAIKMYDKEFRIHPVGTGPFQLKYNYEGEKVILSKNEEYYLTDSSGKLPHLERVDISFIPSKQTEFLKFLNGKLSIMSGLDVSFKDDLLEKDGELKQKFKNAFQFQKLPFLNTEYLGIITDPEINKTPLENKKIRQAIAYAVNRGKIIRYLRNNIGIPGTFGFVPPALMNILDSGESANNITSYYKYDLQKARSILEELGYSVRHPLKGVTIVTTDQYLDMAILVQKSLEDLNIQVEVNNVPPSSLSEMKAQGKANFFRGSWIADYPDPENYFSIFYSKNIPPAGPNYFHYANSKFDLLYDSALIEPDDKKRNKIYFKMQEILMGDCPAIVLFYDEIIRLVDKSVEGLNQNAINLIDLRHVRIK
jgi:peptide/nickel transport system substrate-binding protein